MRNILKLLKNCPNGTKLWTEMFGEVELVKVDESRNEIVINTKQDGEWILDQYGRYCESGGLVIWPSDGESWDDFKGNLWNPENLKPFDKVLVMFDKLWVPGILSGYHDKKFYLIGHTHESFSKVLPWTDETKELAWTDKMPKEGWKIW